MRERSTQPSFALLLARVDEHLPKRIREKKHSLFVSNMCNRDGPASMYAWSCERAILPLCPYLFRPPRPKVRARYKVSPLFYKGQRPLNEVRDVVPIQPAPEPCYLSSWKESCNLRMNGWSISMRSRRSSMMCSCAGSAPDGCDSARCSRHAQYLFSS